MAITRTLWHDSHVREYIKIKLKEKMEEFRKEQEKSEIKYYIWKRALDILKANGFSFDEVKMIYPLLDHYKWEDADYHPPSKLSKSQYQDLSFHMDAIKNKYPGYTITYVNEDGVYLTGFIPNEFDPSKKHISIIPNKFFNYRIK